MKVKTAELKARLSFYLRKIRETGEPVEVLLREEPIAYLAPLGGARGSMPPARAAEFRALQGALAGAGLALTNPGAPAGSLPELAPVTAGDGRCDVATVAAMRAEKDW